MSDPLLTVVMSVYNGQQYVAKAIDSILAQSFQCFKFIIVNNGSKDNTANILKKYAEQDARISIITSPLALSYVEGRTLAINEVTTDWFAIMDADDIAMPDRLKRQLDHVRRYGDQLGAIGTWGYYINEAGQQLGVVRSGPASAAIFHQLYEDNEAVIILDPSSVIHRPTFVAAGGYRSECVPAADLDLWYRISEQGRVIVSIPEPLLQYRIHSSSESVKKTLFQRKKTHYINLNMRNRRSGKPEISWEKFNEAYWSQLSYKIPRYWNDLAMTFYKKAGLCYGQKKYFKLVGNLILASMLKPSLVLKRLYLQRYKFDRVV